jgi:hypothetical protein
MMKLIHHAEVLIAPSAARRFIQIFPGLVAKLNLPGAWVIQPTQ